MSTGLSRFFRVFAASALAASLLVAPACSTDDGGDGGGSTGGATTDQDSGPADGGTTADGETTGEDAAQSDTGTGSSSGGEDAGNSDAGSTSSSSGGSDTGSSSGALDAGSSSGGEDAGTKPGKSCKGTLTCQFYEMMGDMKQCAADTGCKATNLKCVHADPKAGLICAQAKTSGMCAQAAKMGCKWNGKTCYLQNWCAMHKSPKACATETKSPCAWAPSKCTGFASKNSCADAPNMQGCQMAPGCQWTDCQVSNGGVEICDGQDNDCNGKPDDPQTPQGFICDDGDQCNGAELCKAGKCAAGLAKKCPAKPCHNVACDKLKGCVYTPNKATCNDKNPCTIKDMCAEGKCAGAAEKDCNDGNKCTKDVCQAVGGKATCKNLAGQGCDDKNPCTDDSCDAKTGGCKNTAIAGCKVCTTASQCNDNDNCTKDSCGAGKCVWAKISGCIGPLDYAVKALKPVTQPFGIPGAVKFLFTARNDGKSSTLGYKGIMSWKLYFSEDATLDEKTDKYIYAAKWKGYNIGGNTKPEYTLPIGVGIQDPAWVAGKKYACVRTFHTQDKNPANNTLCVPVKFLLPDFKVESFGMVNPNTAYKAGGYMYLKFAFKAVGSPASYVHTNFWLSEDAKWDPKTDLINHAVPIKFPAMKTGQVAKNPQFKVGLNAKAQQRHKYICFVVNYVSDAYKKESNPNDNAMCAPIKVSNLPDISIAVNSLYFKLKNGGNYGNVPWGGEYTCGLSAITNGSYGDVDGSFPIRCWLADATNWYYGSANIKWAVEWTWTGKIPGKTSIKTVVGDKYAKLEPKTMGVKYICGHMNHDKSLKEKAYNNYTCRKITVTGIDLMVKTGTSKFGSPSWKHGQPGTLKRGMDLTLEYQWCNQGNQVFYPKNKHLNQRFFISKDDKVSADDVKIAESNVAGFAKIGGLNKYGKPSCAHGILTGKKHKIPMTVTPGTYYLIWDINADGKYLEPMTTNTYARKVVIQ